MSYGLGCVKVAIQLSLLLKLQLTDKGLHHDCNWQAVSFYCAPLHPYTPTCRCCLHAIPMSTHGYLLLIVVGLQHGTPRHHNWHLD